MDADWRPLVCTRKAVLPETGLKLSLDFFPSILNVMSVRLRKQTPTYNDTEEETEEEVPYALP